MRVQRICIGILDDEGVCGECAEKTVGPGLVGMGFDDRAELQVLCDPCLSKKDCRHAQVLMFLVETDRLVSKTIGTSPLTQVFSACLRRWKFPVRAFRDADGNRRK